MADKVKKQQTEETSIESKKKTSAQSGIVIAILLVLCYFFGFSYVWNTSYGSEASVNGWNYIWACVTWNFKGTSVLYGKGLAVPFNYYAKYYVRVLSVATTVTFVLLIIYIALTVFNVIKFRKKLEITQTVLLYALAAGFLVCIVTALTMNGSKILPGYCNNNPECSIATLTFFPFFVSLISAISHNVFIYKNEL